MNTTTYVFKKYLVAGKTDLAQLAAIQSKLLFKEKGI